MARQARATPYAAGFDVLAAKDWWGAPKVLDYLAKLSKQSRIHPLREDERIARRICRIRARLRLVGRDPVARPRAPSASSFRAMRAVRTTT